MKRRGHEVYKMCKDRSDKLIDAVKLALAVRQLENSEIMHDSCDIDCENIHSILSDYGILDAWSDDELEILKAHLLDMAYEAEAREAERLAELEMEESMLAIPLRSAPSPRLLAIQHKLWRAEMAENITTNN